MIKLELTEKEFVMILNGIQTIISESYNNETIRRYDSFLKKLEKMGKDDEEDV